MLAKLLKYDLKKSLKFFAIMYILILGFAIIGRLCAENTEITFFVIVREICSGGIWAIIANLLINNILRLWANFRRSLYGDESYLTHTLPVKPSAIYWSKFITATIILILNLLISALALVIDRGGTDIAKTLNNLLPEISTTLGFSTTGLVWSFVGVIFIEMLTVIATGFLAYIIGFHKNDNKMGWSAFGIFAIYAAVQIFIVLLLLLAGTFNHSLLQIFTEKSSNIDLNLVAPAIAVCLVGYAVSIPALSWLSIRALNRGVDIE